MLNTSIRQNKLNQALFTALRYAESPTLIKLLITAGANVNARDNYGYTVLMRTNNHKIAKILIKAGADVNGKNTYGVTALDLINDSIARLKDSYFDYPFDYMNKRLQNQLKKAKKLKQLLKKKGGKTTLNYTDETD